MPPHATQPLPRRTRARAWHARRIGAAAVASTICLVAGACSSSSSGHHAAGPSATASSPVTASAGATAPTSSPTAGGSVLVAQPIDLSQWQLILPVNKGGDLSGTSAKDEHPAKLFSPWLTQQSDGSLLFWAPAGGATTGHSLHSRTELDFLSSFSAGQGTHTLKATVVVQQLPTVSHDIVIGQIHGYGSTYSAAPFVLLSFDKTTLTVGVEDKPKLGGSTGPSDGEVTTTYTVLKNVALNQPLAYTITADGSQLTFSATLYTASGAQERYGSTSVALPAAWNGVPVNFDAGDYEQDDAASSHSGGGKVAFYALNAD